MPDTALNDGDTVTSAFWTPNVREQVVVRTTSGARPSSPVEGRKIVETDTNAELIYTGSAWVEQGRYGALQSWTPTITQSVAVAATVNRARYQRRGIIVDCWFDLTMTGAGTTANAITLGGLPVTAAAATAIFGGFRYLDQGNTYYVGVIVGASTTTATFWISGNANAMGVAPAFGIANTDQVLGWLSYEAA